MGDMPLYRKVANKIMDLIDKGIFLPGCRIPSERDLAIQFNVSRVVIREAQIALQERGLLEVKTGSGTFVLEKYKINLYGLKKFELLELTEARALIAVEAAAFAAPIITDETIAELHRLTKIMSGTEVDALSPMCANVAFHNKIACATNNNIIILMMDSVWKMRSEESQLQNMFRYDGQYIGEQYVSVIEAFTNRNSVDARNAMRALFATVMEALLVASEEEAYKKMKSKAFENRSRFLLNAQLG